jgi:hypothetical protein
MHQYAFKAAQASVCAQEQGKFWEYHDRLFASSDLSADALKRIAGEVGLKQNAFNQCIASGGSRTAVEKDIAEANRLGVRGTPTFFINGTPFNGGANFAALKQEIDDVMLGLRHSVAKTVGHPSIVWHAAMKNGVGSTLALIQQSALTQIANQPRQTASTTTADGVTLSPASINFGYQLVGTTGPQFTEMVTNSGTAPLTITDISVSGHDHKNFPPTYNFSLPVTVAPGGSVTINLTFTPSLPWRAGTRNAALEISEKKASQYVPLTGIGATCLGAVPSCSSGCPDSDGDGLNDAWEIAGGVDLNNDGVIDATNDLLLAGADPNTPDVYVHYDWMDYGGLETPCATAFDCPNTGVLGSPPVQCTGPPVPGSAYSCVITCQTDNDCRSLGDPHLSDICSGSPGAMTCKHTHDPEALVPGALQAVVARFATHGINLHIERGQARPHSHVISFRTLSEMTDGCEGGSVSSGTAGVGQYAESFFDLKANYFDSKESPAYHYVIFSHYSGCDTADHCAYDGHFGQCALVNGCGTVRAGSTGTSEINGNNFIVSLGASINDGEAFLTNPAPGGAPVGLFIIGGTFMHELGHNLGLRHGGGVSSTPDPTTCTPPDCEDECTTPPEPNFKPNFLSVMNYLYQTSGIESVSAPGEFVPVNTRLDYSTQVLPTVPVSDGVLGVLDERGLDETVPFGLTSGNFDLFSYTDANCGGHLWPTHAAVDWDGDGITGNNTAVMADLNPEENPGGYCPGPAIEQHRGHVDWGPAPGQSIFRYAFQCAPSSDNPLGVSTGELSADEARRAHVLYPTAAVNIIIRPGCKSAAKPIVPGKSGTFTVALMGVGHYLDVRKVDLSSLRFHGARPLRTSVTDMHADGKRDLLITFDMADVKLDPRAKAARLTGWFKSSQNFVGEDKIRVVSTLAGEDANCR